MFLFDITSRYTAYVSSKLVFYMTTLQYFIYLSFPSPYLVPVYIFLSVKVRHLFCFCSPQLPPRPPPAPLSVLMSLVGLVSQGVP